jgi:hypothetical protein
MVSSSELVFVSFGQRVDVWVVNEGFVAVAPGEFLEFEMIKFISQVKQLSQGMLILTGESEYQVQLSPFLYLSR